VQKSKKGWTNEEELRGTRAASLGRGGKKSNGFLKPGAGVDADYGSQYVEMPEKRNKS